MLTEFKVLLCQTSQLRPAMVRAAKPPRVGITFMGLDKKSKVAPQPKLLPLQS